ncbi:MAG TPA: TMEM175 family protein [Rhizomicrobium sp.]|nr:TMEM175 family protein [Rhizomicrobium sp.]
MNSGSAEAPPGTGRIETFSDRVMAILITIVLELKLPVNLFHGGHLAQVLAAFWPRLLVYALSFLVIAIILINHHMILRAAPHSTNALYWWNANLLFWLSLVPLATAVLGNAPVEPAAVAFYGAVMTAASFSLLHHCAVMIGSRTGKLDRIHLLIIYKDTSLSHGLCQRAGSNHCASSLWKRAVKVTGEIRLVASEEDFSCPREGRLRCRRACLRGAGRQSGCPRGCG